MDKIAVLIPCYNEEKTVEKVVTDFRRVLPEATIYVYNNNSSDRTAELAAKAGAVVRNEYMQGKGNVIRRMFREIDAQCYIMADGDDTYPAEHARDMADRVLNRQADMVVGDRLSSTYFTENTRPFHNLGNRLVRGSIQLLFRNNIKDIMTEMSIHAVMNNMHLENVVIDYRDRPEGSVSKLNTYSDGFKVLKTIAKLYRVYKPLGFFGIISLILFLLSAVFFIPVLRVYAITGLVPNFPTLIVCGFTVIAALQSLFSGLILETIRQQNRQSFEHALIQVSDRQRQLLEK